MTQLLERLLLFVCCGLFSLSYTSTLHIVLPILVVVTISSLCGYFDSRNIRLGLMIMYFVLCLFYKDYLFFFPLLAYDFFCTDLMIHQIIFLIPFLFHQGSITPVWCLLILYIIISYCLKSGYHKLATLQQEFHTLQDEAKEITERLHKKNQQLLEKQDFEVKAATLDERNRIAREIHDSVGHQLSSSILQTGALLAITQDTLTRERLTNLKDTLTTSMDSIRHSIHNIHEDSLDLNRKIQGLIYNFTFCHINFEYQVQHDFPIKVKYSLLFIIREALSNIMKHSNATSCLISIYEHPVFYQILIQDNGTLNACRNECGMGITSMEERVASFNGKLHIHRNHGFEIFITIPKTGDD